MPCDWCQIRKTKITNVFRILTNEKNITYQKIAVKGKRRRIKEGSKHLLCERCVISSEWHGITLESIREGLTEKELSIREKKWENKEFKRAIM